jgi:hypothetical protein
MRLALREQATSVQGLRAQLLLRHYLDESSYSDVVELLTLYEGHVIELSAFDIAVGEQPARNTLIWEVRAY